MSSKLANKAYFNKAAGAIKKVPLPIRKFLTRAMPGVGGVVGAADAAQRAKQGDWLGSALSAGSAVPGWGLVPLAGQVATDWMGLTGPKSYGQGKQIPNWQATRKYANGGLANLYRHGGFSG